jgi:hypothetical protein
MVVHADDNAANLPPRRHRIGAGVSYGIRHVSLGHTASQKLEMDGASLGAQLDYGYRVFEELEIGAGAAYWNGPDLNAFAARLRVRPHSMINEWAEVGGTVSGGLLVWPHAEPNAAHDGTEEAYWMGPTLSAAADFTFWMSRGFGAQLFAEGAWGKVSGKNLNPDSTFFVALSAGIGVKGRL